MRFGILVDGWLGGVLLVAVAGRLMGLCCL